MRRRQIDEFFRLDIKATVSATIRSLGFPSFRYAPATRIPAYLVIIERLSPGDHQARLFDEMVRALKREGVVITRYFYRDDPLRVWDEKGETSLRLESLKQRHAGDRLLFLGSGEQMLDPVTGRLAERVAVVSDWHERAILTPESNWAWREEILAENFVLVRATSDGLLALVNQFESRTQSSSANWATPDPHPLPARVENLGALEAVRKYLGEQTFQWLCACAIFSELRWDLTLLLGTLPSMASGIVNETNLLRLSRMTWFRNGSIPDMVRRQLIEALSPEKRTATREVVVRLMEETAPPPADTFAAGNYEFELNLNRWLLSNNRTNLRKLRDSLKQVPAPQLARSDVNVSLLKSVPHPIFGRRFPGLFYRRGIPNLGLSTFALALIAIALLVAIVSVIRLEARNVPEWTYAAFLPSATPTPSITSPPSPNPVITPLASPTATVTVTTTSTPRSPAPTPTSTLTPAPSPTPGTFEDQEITFSFPLGSEQIDNNRNTAAWQIKSGGASAHIIVTVATMDKDFPADKSIAAMYSAAETRMKNGVVDELNWMTIEGLKGVQLRESPPESDRPDDIRRLQWMGFRKHNGELQLVNILLAATGKDFPTFQTQLYEILRSTKLGHD